MKILKTLAALAGLTAAAGVGQVAKAQPATQTVAVHYGDLDLGSAGGRAALDSRLRQAVRTACGEPSPSDLRGLNRAADCRVDLTRSLAAHRDAVYAAASTRPLVLVARR